MEAEEAALKEAEEEERQARLGPGGLDPIEVLESLPEVIKTWSCSGNYQQIIVKLLKRIDKNMDSKVFIFYASSILQKLPKLAGRKVPNALEVEWQLEVKIRPFMW